MKFEHNFRIIIFFTEAEYDYSSYSDYLIDGSVFSSNSVVASEVIGVNSVLPLFSNVDLVPINVCTTRVLPPNQPQFRHHSIKNCLIKWSLPPPAMTAASLPGWMAMP